MVTWWSSGSTCSAVAVQRLAGPEFGLGVLHVYYNAAMGQVPVRELNQDTAGVLARVESGETVEITRHGRVIGRIVPAGVGELDDWVAQGRAVPATIGGPIPMPALRAEPGSEAGQLLRDMRDEERW
jgi:prevent-host-death family protein